MAGGATGVQWRRIATRYDKLARNFLAAAVLVGALYWIKKFELAIYFPALKILIAASHVDSVENIDMKTLEQLSNMLLEFPPLACISHKASHG